MVNTLLCNNKFYKWMLLGSLCLASFPVLSESFGNKASIEEDRNYYKLPNQQFMIFLEKGKVKTIEILVKKKINFRRGQSREQWRMYNEEEERILSLLKKMKGRIYIYHSGARSLDYDITYPIDNSSVKDSFFDVNGDEWVGYTYPGFTVKNTGNYVISTVFYSNSNEYSDYMVGFTESYSTK